MNIFRHKSVIERQLDKTAVEIRHGIDEDIRLRELQERDRQRKLLWANMSPRLKMKLLKYVEERKKDAQKEKNK